MTSLVLVDRRNREWLTLSWARLLTGASAVVPVLVAVVVLLLAAGPTPWWPALFVLALALLAAVVPDSSVGTLLFVGYLAWWVSAVPASGVGWALGAALCLLACHGGLALAATGPPGCAVAAAVRRRYVVRLVAVAAATGPVAAVAWYAGGAGVAPYLLVALTLMALGALPVLVARPR